MQLELCHKLNKGDRVIAAVYISLAITFAENGEVQNALEYYQKELDLRNSAGLNNDFKEVIFQRHLSISKLLIFLIDNFEFQMSISVFSF